VDRRNRKGNVGNGIFRKFGRRHDLAGVGDIPYLDAGKTKPVFVVATANDISKSPPELVRKVRVDEIFFVDLPTEKEREEIIKIHLHKKGREPTDYNVSDLAKASKGYSGAELEGVVKEALFQSYDLGRALKDEDLLDACSKTFPLA